MLSYEFNSGKFFLEISITKRNVDSAVYHIVVSSMFMGKIMERITINGGTSVSRLFIDVES